MKITNKGQVTIPVEIRERFGLHPNTEVDFQIQLNSVRLVKANRKRAQRRGADVIKRLAGKGNVRMTTDQILALTRDQR
jgi:AbrB family looped-hinge helix DNA binding protein